MRLPFLALLLSLVLAAPARAEDATVTSFDGTRIRVTFMPAAGLGAGERAPTVLMTHGWGATRERDPESESREAFGQAGVKALREAGFNVLTWDSRGFGESGGTVTVDSKEFEGRDVQALLDWLARRPEARLDAAGDPRVGMHGPSYAGGIELVAAGMDGRIDAIAPAIAWNSLLTALYREELAKGGWGSILVGLGAPSSALLGLVSPVGPETGNLDPHIYSAFQSGLATGRYSAEDRAWFASRGLPELVQRIRVPTFLVQGTADTLFTPSEAIRNYEIVRGNGVPVKMLWFCGGHGACLTGAGEGGRVERRVVAWLRRHVVGDTRADVGPRFEWLADDAQWRTAADWPLAPGAPLVAEGAGTLALSPADSASGTLISAQPSPKAVNVPIPAPGAETDAVGEPQLELTYSGTATQTETHVFAQIVDERRGVVLGTQVTPIAVTLDGARRTRTIALEGIAARLRPDSRYTLQVIGGTNVYGPARTAGLVTLHRLRLTMPTANAAATRDRGDTGAGTRSCLSRRQLAITLFRGARGVRVTTTAGKVRVRRGKVLADFRGVQGKRTMIVRIRGRHPSGRRFTVVRRYRLCTARSAPARRPVSFTG